jgi:hypothetical protein
LLHGDTTMKHTTSRALATTLALGLLATVGAPSTASACGGCFGPQQTVQVVTDHRMVMAIHSDESVLWDQIRYSGRPEDFSWVLPVRGDVEVMTAEAAFFDQLDALTAPVLQAPVACPGASRGGFGGALATSAASPPDSSNAGVMVIRTETVGPYQSVLLRSTDADALATWLRANGYVIPPALEPVIQSYNDMHMDFYAMRLRPGEGVQAMQPVRVRFATPSPVLPLRMIAAGAADKVGINLMVVGEGRWETQNFPTVRVDASALVWDWRANTSNYNDVFRAAVNGAGGRGWVVESAQPAQSYQWRLESAAMSDWALAVRGMSRPWVTRLRTDLATRYLDHDLQLAASASDESVPNFIAITRTRNAPQCLNSDGFYTGTDTSASAGLNCAARPGTSTRGNGGVALMAGLALAVTVARRRRNAR